ncbi:MAG: hypothetical protein C4K58_06135 [Flavobacteriaceae bacterium]|nr:MAG: hypothetical protein C4K58_06135 [Flavobacteriaceae bacterium]
MKTSQNIPPTVKVFYFDLNKIDSITNGQLENKLSLKQQIEISTFKNPKIRLQKTLSKLCLNWLIKQQGLPFDYIDNLSYSPLGKPYFPNVSFGFNFSHSNRLMSFAYSDTLSDIGVDVQEIVSIKKMEKLLPKLCQSEQDFLSNHPNKPLGFTQKTLGMVLSFTMDVFSVMFISFFFVKDSELFTKMIKSIVPDSKESKAERALDSIEHLLVRYFFGLLLQVLVMFVLYLIILKVFSIQDSVVIALICALLNIIPYIGPLIGMFVFTFLASSSLFSSGIPMNDAFVQKIIYLVVGYLIAQLIDNFVNQPIIYSKSVKSHPLEIFIVILCFGVLFGFVGILVAVPAYTAIKVIAKEFLWEFKLVKSITKDL